MMPPMSALHSSRFWFWFSSTALLTGGFFAWELGVLPLPSLPRPAPTHNEIFFTILLVFLLALNAGLLAWKQESGTCPIGTKKATGIAGTLGVITLLCPVCLLIPFTLFGATLSLAILSPFLPLLRMIALVLLGVSTWMLLKK